MVQTAYYTTIKEYLKTTSPNKWSYNDFLSKNKALLIAERGFHKWTDRNRFWKKLFMDAVIKIIEDDKIIQKLKNEKYDRNFWLYIKDSQKLEIIRERQIKLKRKVDLYSIEIYDKSTSKQGFDPEKFYEEIHEEVRNEIFNEIRNKIWDEI
ncbi:hypothetical protein Glove_273g5 [Diversispora epigaea]|uniref:Uncharacterized protein n=1 Tax=Diversispora epigaea TaxID=1348612 RepID=A0A397IA48_9GLOM|nr:hypothetical protein Glove_273g5 [Diversispora epigaea]